ncbi:MAG: TlpA family protein disulfide reductase [Halioglobus sp.]
MRFITLLVTTLVLTACQGDNKDISGSAISDYRGQWLVINYWAKWCKPCIKEIPELNEFDSKFDYVSVLGVNYDGAVGEDLAQQIRDFSIEFPVLEEDPATELGTRRPTVLPTTLIVNPSGELRETLLGPQSVGTLTKAIEMATAKET